MPPPMSGSDRDEVINELRTAERILRRVHDLVAHRLSEFEDPTLRRFSSVLGNDIDAARFTVAAFVNELEDRARSNHGHPELVGKTFKTKHP